MKLFLSIFVFIISSAKVKADLLDGLDHDHDHHHDHDDHLDHDDDISRLLLEEIERFLPHEETPVFDVPSAEEPFDFGISFEDQFNELPLSLPVDTGNTGLEQGFGVPLISPTRGPAGRPETTPRNLPLSPPKDLDNTRGHSGVPLSPPVEPVARVPEKKQTGIPLSQVSPPVSDNRVPDVQTVPQVQDIADNALPQHESSFGLPPVDPVNNNIENQFVVDYDSNDEDLTLHVDIPDSLSSPTRALDSPVKDYEDISDNFIESGQGRQLDSGVPQQAPFAPNSLSPFDGDFPSFEVIPRTSFSCGDHEFGGYYADQEAECQVFHVCLGGGPVGSFLCPYGTLFNQALFVCDWWYNVDCSLAPDSFHLNSRIGVIDDSDEHFS